MPNSYSLTCDEPQPYRMAVRARQSLSRPFRDAIRDSLLKPSTRVLDYGCGRGDDVRLLRELGYDAVGWDPLFFPEPKPVSASLVNLGYVLNVIACPEARAACLKRAFTLARDVLIVSGYVRNGCATSHRNAIPSGDGVITSKGTFQKLFTQVELNNYIRYHLKAKVRAADFGVYYVFKRMDNMDDTDRSDDVIWGNPRRQLVIDVAASYSRPIGRLLKREFTTSQKIVLRSSFSSYAQLCSEAELELTAAHSADVKGWFKLGFGKLTQEAVYFHKSALAFVPSCLQLHIAKALARTKGENFNWEVVKVWKNFSTISLLDCEPFCSVDHPALIQTLTIDTKQAFPKRRRESSHNPSIYHRKELFVHPSNEHFDAFKSLTEDEERLGLLSRSDIGRKQSWSKICNQLFGGDTDIRTSI